MRKEAGKSQLAGRMNLAVLQQVGDIEARLQVLHLPRYKRGLLGLRRQGIAAVVRQKGGQPGLRQRHRPGFAQVVGAAFAGVFTQN